jgi:hypothetical protein
MSDGARKINSQGGAIFIHDDWRQEKGTEVRAVANIPQWPIASIEIRDFVYGRLIEHSPATLYPDALITGEKGLLVRGLDESHFGNYGGLPADPRERDRLARLLLQEARGRFPNAAEPGEAIPEPVAFCAEAIASSFFSVDVARRADGVDRIVEIGDGQVSDLSGWSVGRFVGIWSEAR